MCFHSSCFIALTKRYSVVTNVHMVIDSYDKVAICQQPPNLTNNSELIGSTSLLKLLIAVNMKFEVTELPQATYQMKNQQILENLYRNLIIYLRCYFKKVMFL